MIQKKQIVAQICIYARLRMKKQRFGYVLCFSMALLAGMLLLLHISRNVLVDIAEEFMYSGQKLWIKRAYWYGIICVLIFAKFSFPDSRCDLFLLAGLAVVLTFCSGALSALGETPGVVLSILFLGGYALSLFPYFLFCCRIEQNRTYGLVDACCATLTSVAIWELIYWLTSTAVTDLLLRGF